MRPEESELIGRWLRDLDLPRDAVSLNIGSSDEGFTAGKPHIERNVYRPLKQRGVRIINCDLKNSPGVDEVGDVFDPVFQERLKAYKADLLICANLLEHLERPRDFTLACGELLKPGGFALFTVPLSYPYHPDPIDTMFRPHFNEVAAMLPGWSMEKGVGIAAGNEWNDIKARQRRPYLYLAKRLLKVALPFYDPTGWYARAHRMLWLWRPFKVTLVLLRKPDSVAPGYEQERVLATR